MIIKAIKNMKYREILANKIILIITIVAFIIFSYLLLIDTIFEHEDTYEHLSKCPFSSFIAGIILSLVFGLILLLMTITYAIPTNKIRIQNEKSHYSFVPRGPPEKA